MSEDQAKYNLQDLFDISKDDLIKKLNYQNKEYEKELFEKVLAIKEGNIKENLRITLQEIKAFPNAPQKNLEERIDRINRDFEVIALIRLLRG